MGNSVEHCEITDLSLLFKPCFTDEQLLKSGVSHIDLPKNNVVLEEKAITLNWSATFGEQ